MDGGSCRKWRVRGQNASDPPLGLSPSRRGSGVRGWVCGGAAALETGGMFQEVRKTQRGKGRKTGIRSNARRATHRRKLERMGVWRGRRSGGGWADGWMGRWVCGVVAAPETRGSVSDRRDLEPPQRPRGSWSDSLTWRTERAASEARAASGDPERPAEPLGWVSARPRPHCTVAAP